VVKARSTSGTIVLGQEHVEVASILSSEALTVYRIDYTAVDEKPDTLFMCLKSLVGPRGRSSNFPACRNHGKTFMRPWLSVKWRF